MLPFETAGFAPRIEEEFGAVDIRDRKQELMTKHQKRGDVMGELIDRCRRELVSRAQAAEKARREEKGAVVVNVRVPEVGADRVRPYFA